MVFLAKKWRRLSQGIGNIVEEKNTLDFIDKHEAPHGRQVTHGNSIRDHRPLKSKNWRVRLMVGVSTVSNAYRGHISCPLIQNIPF